MTPRRPTPLAAALLLALAGCAGSTGLSSYSGAPQVSAADNALNDLQRKDYAGAARAFEQAALQAAPPQTFEYHLRAAEAATDGNDYAYAGIILDALPPSLLDSEQAMRWRLLRARAALARNDAAEAIHLLPENPGDSPLSERILLLRGRALFRLNDGVRATRTLVQRERLLSNPALIAENRDAIWSGLSAVNLDAAALARAGDSDLITRGWVELANLVHRNASLDQYEGWRERYPGHPAQERLATVMMTVAPPPSAAPPPVATGSEGATAAESAPGAAPVTAGAAATPPARPGFFALLLPGGDNLAGKPESFHQGFVAAAARAGNGTDVRVYEAGTPAATLSSYSQAIADGAGVVVGPLLKVNVAALSQAGGLRTPVLALNYLDAGQAATPGLYQFGLAPEDEARAAAEDAAARGLRRALVLVPENERGARMAAAFEQRLRELGGEVRESARYSGEFKDWSTPISDLLHYRPVSDKKALAELRAKAAPGIDPQRRNDFDLIFMDAGAAQARQLWPLFRYYHAERMAIYDTAAVNDGHGDSDLAGIRFCDAPWVLDTANTWTALRDDALNGRALDQARFYALGDDAFQLAMRLSQNGLHAQDELPGASGTLHVNDDSSVHRSLICAITTPGDPHPLDPPSAAPLPPQ
jgi:outer membrane PBP1 activator LpoA protein